MAAGDQILYDWQQEYNGLLLGDKTNFELVSGDKLMGSPTARSGTIASFGRHGGVPGRHLLPLRDFFLKWDIKAQDEDTFRTRRQLLGAAFAIRTEPEDELPLVFSLENRIYRINCRPIDNYIPLNMDFANFYTEAAIRFEAAWPFIESNSLGSATLSIATTTEGLQFPATFPLVFGAGTGGSASVVNNGNAPAPWVATISGDTPNPRITHVESGKFIEFVGLTIVAGDVLTLDSKNKSVLLNGTASRRSYMTAASRWFDLQPGSNTIQFSSGGITTGQLTFTWRDTYWSI